MSLVSRLIGSRKADSAKNGSPAKQTVSASLGDGAIDTLAIVLRAMGEHSFPVDTDVDSDAFPEACREFSSHVENGSGVPSFDIPPSKKGEREWARVRRFFSDRRRTESDFVKKRLHDYRGVVEDLVSGLRVLGERDQATEDSVKRSLGTIEDAIGVGNLPGIREALAQTVRTVSETFAQQKRQYETQLQELNDRMSNLRQDLVAAREEMKRDSLTDAYNRRAFDTAILQALNMHFILNQPVTLILIDLDNFKAVNDNYGHAAGDEVLRAIGECLARSFIRKSDLVARYGGDEFAVILNDTTAENAEQVLERFLKCVEGVKIPYAPEGTCVSCSAGYTEIVDGDSTESLIVRADKGLYRAKHQGRNRAVLMPFHELQ